ncbi:glycosyltransferase [Candidatus Sumerlaeota bacterium]|nr:glycosyltransferase [Candidatus Sumerlaeota bacterium]
MAKLLVVGLGPLLEQGVRHFGGQCLRTWYFAKPLIDDGHTVRLVTLPIYDPDEPDMHKAALVRRSFEGFEYQAFTNSDFDFIHLALTQVARSLAPDGIVAVNVLAAWAAARLPVCVPLWADLNGYEMAEKQGQAARTGDDALLLDAWRREALVARRADKLSTVSRPQLHALLGEMASVGRLNRHTFHYHFVHHIPNAYHPVFAVPLPPDARPLLRGKIVPSDAFIVLWSGGYNYWTDPEFLFACIEKAMAASRYVHYVSTGGAIAGYNTETYETFRRLVDESPHRDRYHLLGWIPAEDLIALYHEADLGLNIDEPNYETFFGARNRLNNMMAAGLPVLTTFGSEVSRSIDEAHCGVVCPPNDPLEVAHGILSMVQAPEQCHKIGERARTFALETFSPGHVVAPVREWAHAPSFAPDNAEKLRRNPETVNLTEVALNPLQEAATISASPDLFEMRRAIVDLQAIRSKLWYRTLKSFKDSSLKWGRRCLRGGRWAARGGSAAGRLVLRLLARLRTRKNPA